MWAKWNWEKKKHSTNIDQITKEETCGAYLGCSGTRKEELAAVTVPWGLTKAGFNLPICSKEDGRIPLSWDTMVRPGKRHNLVDLLGRTSTRFKYKQQSFSPDWCFRNRSALAPGTLKEMTSCSSPASWAFLARECDRRANSSCSCLETPKAAAKRSALWPIVSAVENSATAGSYKHKVFLFVFFM